jgi:hypothetical protein
MMTTTAPSWKCYVRLLLIPSVHPVVVVVVTRRSLCVGKLPKERYCGILPYYFDNEEGAETSLWLDVVTTLGGSSEDCLVTFRFTRFWLVSGGL